MEVNQNKDTDYIIIESGSEQKKERDSIPWKVLVVDDDEPVHSSTSFLLENLIFMERPVNLIHVYSKKEAMAALESDPHIALILLDVVMESEHAGLEFVKHVREEMDNIAVQIILRTGQPGVAAEEKVMKDYHIGGYLLKSETDLKRIQSHVIYALRAYRDLWLAELRDTLNGKVLALVKDEISAPGRDSCCFYEEKLLQLFFSTLDFTEEQRDKCSAIYGRLPKSIYWYVDEETGEQKHRWELKPLEFSLTRKNDEKYRAEYLNDESRPYSIIFFSNHGKYADLEGVFKTPEVITTQLTNYLAKETKRPNKQSVYEDDMSFIVRVVTDDEIYRPRLINKERGVHFIYLEGAPQFDTEVAELFLKHMRRVISDHFYYF